MISFLKAKRDTRTRSEERLAPGTQKGTRNLREGRPRQLLPDDGYGRAGGDAAICPTSSVELQSPGDAQT
jgi:hypothetical protein